MANANDKNITELLENAVLYGTVEELTTILQEYAPFEFTARALGWSCIYGGTEKTKVLLDAGCSFAFDYSPHLLSLIHI